MRIDVWSDVVCPWCWLGKARLERALEDFPHRDRTDVHFHAFQLDPRMPKDLDVPTSEMLGKKYGMGPAQIAAAHERLRGLGEEVGVDFHFEQARTSNTLEAHELIAFAREKGKELAMVERLFRANFHDGIRIGERSNLLRLATEVGLDAGEAAAALADSRHASTVQADIAQAAELGVTGVPFFVIGGVLGVSGAQPAVVLRRVLDDGWARASSGPASSGTT
jgi:predicted DsbA family dithiol-disulfide isomerase